MKDYLRNISKLKYLFLLFVFFQFIRCSNTVETNKPDLSVRKSSQTKNPVLNQQIAVEPPPFSDGIFPCNDCHKDQKPNPVRRKLVDFHEEISAMFNHDSENRWCLDCHDQNNRDSLRLASGKLLDFKESLQVMRTMSRRQIKGLESRSSWKKNRRVER